jgi:catechol 2,3-dioxygenase-like lactoylglutathione lyase family enzyme
MRLQNVVYACDRYAEMVAFYRDGLGLAVFFENPGCCFLHLGSGYLALHPVGDGAVPTAGACLDFAVEDVEAAAAEAESRGLTVDRRDGMGILRDPAGNIVELVKG